jgi:membrane-associated phospholipid phosphatase
LELAGASRERAEEVDFRLPFGARFALDRGVASKAGVSLARRDPRSRERLGVRVTFVLVFCLGVGGTRGACAQGARPGLDPDSPFRLSVALDLSLFVAGAGLSVAGRVWQRQTDLVDADEIATLDRADVNGFDRVATRLWSVPAQRTSDVGLALAFLAPAALFASERVRRDGWRFAVMWSEVYVFTQGLTELSKAWTARIRPYMYNDAVAVAEKTRGHLASQGRSSFFSGHSSVGAALFFYGATVLQAYHPRSRWSRAGWGTAVVLSTLTASMRVAGGRHYPTDVLVGHALGATVGLAVPMLHRLVARRGLTITPEAGAGRLALTIGGWL